jgi:hypothetical protein
MAGNMITVLSMRSSAPRECGYSRDGQTLRQAASSRQAGRDVETERSTSMTTLTVSNGTAISLNQSGSTLYTILQASGFTLTSISVTAAGAAGNWGTKSENPAGNGGQVTATIPVTSEWGNQGWYQLMINIGSTGASGSGGYNGGGHGGSGLGSGGQGGGGGGRTDIQLMVPQPGQQPGQQGQPGPYIIFAGGGGGSGQGTGKSAGGQGGAGGQNATAGGSGASPGGSGGGGANGDNGGSGGAGMSSSNGYSGSDGGAGGPGGFDTFGTSHGGGGGGAGYAGGGGGGAAQSVGSIDNGGGGGGGGSSYLPVLDQSNPPTNIQYQDGTNEGNGSITVTFNGTQS